MERTIDSSLSWKRAMSAIHVAVILRTRTGPAYEEESMKRSEERRVGKEC